MSAPNERLPQDARREGFQHLPPPSPPRAPLTSYSVSSGNPEASRSRQPSISSNVFSFSMKYDQPSRTAEGELLAPERTGSGLSRPQAPLALHHAARSSKARSYTWTSARSRSGSSPTINSPSFPFASSDIARSGMVRAATASSSSQGAPSLRHDYLTVAEPSPRSTQSHEWQQRANLCPSEPGLSSSDKPYRSSSSPPAVDVDERPGQLLDDPQVSATGLVKTLPTGLSFEEAEEAPPPSLSSLMLDPEKEPRRYVLDVVEQPAHGRLCGFTTRDRRMLDPTPILSLQIFDKDGHLDVGAMSAPHFLTHATIRALDDGDRTLVINPANELAVRMVEGVQVQNGLYISEDKTTYFSFPDLSVRLAGRYQLLFSLIRLGPGLGNSPAASSSQRPFVSPAHTNAAGTVVASTTSAEFEVFAPRRFPGVVFSSVLTRRLGERGLKVHVRNRNASDQEQTQYGSGAASSHP